MNYGGKTQSEWKTSAIPLIIIHQSGPESDEQRTRVILRFFPVFYRFDGIEIGDEIAKCPNWKAKSCESVVTSDFCI